MTHELDDCIGQELNITKSYGMATSRKSRRLLNGVRVGTSSVRYTNDARSLGAHIVTTKTKRASMARIRADKAVSALKRVKALLVPRKARRIMPAAVGISKATFGTTITGLSEARLKALRTKLIQTVMGHKKPHAAPELITTLLLDASRSDPPRIRVLSWRLSA